MMIRNISELPAQMRKNSCLLGIDYGSKVIGIAVSDPSLSVASPLASIVRKKFSADAAAFAAIVKERNIGGLVVGLPKNMDGSESRTAQAARAFIRNLMQKNILPDSDIPVVFWDERLSTAAVERFLIEDGMSRKRRDSVIDKTAAAYILQGALDAIRNADVRISG
ncbi:MAG: Holliday junction resolvase RuvX [Bdellovibrionales bacterium]